MAMGERSRQVLGGLKQEESGEGEAASSPMRWAIREAPLEVFHSVSPLCGRKGRKSHHAAVVSEHLRPVRSEP